MPCRPYGQARVGAHCHRSRPSAPDAAARPNSMGAQGGTPVSAAVRGARRSQAAGADSDDVRPRTEGQATDGRQEFAQRPTAVMTIEQVPDIPSVPGTCHPAMRRPGREIDGEHCGTLSAVPRGTAEARSLRRRESVRQGEAAHRLDGGARRPDGLIDQAGRHQRSTTVRGYRRSRPEPGHSHGGFEVSAASTEITRARYGLSCRRGDRAR